MHDYSLHSPRKPKPPQVFQPKFARARSAWHKPCCFSVLILVLALDVLNLHVHLALLAVEAALGGVDKSGYGTAADSSPDGFAAGVGEESVHFFEGDACFERGSVSG
jgi:hypothetical protein